MPRDKPSDGGLKNQEAEVDLEKNSNFFKYYEATITLVKAIVWPVMVFFFFLVLRVPITDTVRQLPQLISNTSQLNVGGVTWSIKTSTLTQAPTGVRGVLANLSPDAIKLLVMTGNVIHYTNTSYPSYADEKNTYTELVNVGLINLYLNINDPNHPDLNVKWNLTKLGQETYSFLITVILDQMLSPTPIK